MRRRLKNIRDISGFMHGMGEIPASASSAIEFKVYKNPGH